MAGATELEPTASCVTGKGHFAVTHEGGCGPQSVDYGPAEIARTASGKWSICKAL